MTLHELAALFSLDQEKRDRLERYAELLVKWQKTINLVGPSTLGEMATRHFLDSAQLFPLLPPNTRVLVDLGSGAGFPGLVLAALGVPEVHLIESDQRKCAFLREVARALSLSSVKVHPRRIEAVEPFPADVVTARALAPLPVLLKWAFPFCGSEGECLFLKGRNCDEELILAQKEWKMTTERITSRSDPSGVIVRIKGVSRDRAE